MILAEAQESPTLFVYSCKLRSGRGQYEFITKVRMRTPSMRFKPYHVGKLNGIGIHVHTCTTFLHIPYYFHTRSVNARAMKFLLNARVFLTRSAHYALWRAPVRHREYVWRMATRLAGSKLTGQGAKFLIKVRDNGNHSESVCVC